MNKIYIVLALLVLIASTMAAPERVLTISKEDLNSVPPRFGEGTDVTKLMELTSSGPVGTVNEYVSMKVIRRKAAIESPSEWIRVMKVRLMNK